MHAAQRHPAASLFAPARQARAPQRVTLAAAPDAGNDALLPWLDRWTERFIDRLVAWGDGATHRRLGSWTRY